MRFFECVANTESLRVKSEVVDHDAWDEDLAPWEVKHGLKSEKQSAIENNPVETVDLYTH